jgi:hypothetical protein
MRKKVGTILILAVIALMMAPNQVAAIRLLPKAKPEYYQELVCTENIYVNTPEFVLYDPPGHGSYSEFTVGQSVGFGINYEFLGGPVPIAVDGHASTSFTVSETWGTPADQQLGHRILVVELYQTWQLWYVSSPVYEGYKLKLVGSTYEGESAYTFSTLPSDVWVTDMTGQQGTYSTHRGLPADTPYDVTYQYDQVSYTQIGFGVNIPIYGMTFKLKLQATISSGYTVSCHYHVFDHDSYISLYINSDVPLTGIPNVGGIGVWFCPGSVN